MTGVLGQLFGPQKTVVQDRKAMELAAAREILAEVFGIRLSDVDEMIENRSRTGMRWRGFPKRMGCGRRSFGWRGEVSILLSALSREP